MKRAPFFTGGTLVFLNKKALWWLGIGLLLGACRSGLGNLFDLN
jgi:hypothetical protein